MLIPNLAGNMGDAFGDQADGFGPALVVPLRSLPASAES
jgi:hypothetical protein